MAENPKDIAGGLKLPFADIPGIVLAEVGVAMHEGARKYGAFNYRETPIAASAYYSAAQRHLLQWFELGEDIDDTCGLSHITKAIACLMVLRDAQINDRCKDDRPPSASPSHWRQLELIAERLRDKYPDAKPRVTEWGYPDKVPEYRTVAGVARRTGQPGAFSVGAVGSARLPSSNWLAGVECGEFPVDGPTR